MGLYIFINHNKYPCIAQNYVATTLSNACRRGFSGVNHSAMASSGETALRVGKLGGEAQCICVFLSISEIEILYFASGASERLSDRRKSRTAFHRLGGKIRVNAPVDGTCAARGG